MIELMFSFGSEMLKTTKFRLGLGKTMKPKKSVYALKQRNKSIDQVNKFQNSSAYPKIKASFNNILVLQLNVNRHIQLETEVKVSLFDWMHSKPFNL